MKYLARSIVFVGVLVSLASVASAVQEQNKSKKTAKKQNAPADKLDETPTQLLEARDASKLSSRTSIVKASQYCIDAELLRIHSVIDLEDQTFIRIRQAAKPEVMSLRKIFTTAVVREFKQPDVTSIEVMKKLWARTREVIPQNQRQRFDEYVKSAKQTYSLSRQNGIRGTIMCLERYVSLNPQQIKEIEDLLNKAWDEKWNSIPALALFNRPNYFDVVFNRLDQSKLERMLSSDQMSVLARPDDFHGPNVFGAGWRIMNGKQDAATLRLKLEADRMSSMLDLDDGQRARLKVATKGVIAQFTRKEQMGDEGDSGKEEKREHTEEAIIFRLKKHPYWQKTIHKMLTEEQKKTLRAADQALTRRYRLHLITKLSIYTFGEAEAVFGMDDHQKFIDMLDANLPPLTHYDFSDSFQEYFTLDEKIVGDALPTEVWERFRKEFMRRKKRQ